MGTTQNPFVTLLQTSVWPDPSLGHTVDRDPIRDLHLLIWKSTALHRQESQTHLLMIYLTQKSLRHFQYLLFYAMISQNWAILLCHWQILLKTLGMLTNSFHMFWIFGLIIFVYYLRPPYPQFYDNNMLSRPLFHPFPLFAMLQQHQGQQPNGNPSNPSRYNLN